VSEAPSLHEPVGARVPAHDRPEAARPPCAGGVRASDVVGLAAWLALFLAAIALAPPIFTRGESREGLVVQSLVAGGDWIAPRREGVLASKPPLYHWIAAATASVVGESDLVVRLPSALAAWALVLATFTIGIALFDRRRAWLAVGMLATTAGFWGPAVEARVDMIFAATIATALAGFAWWLRTSRRGGRLVLYLGCAAAVLAKGPAGIVLPGAIVVATLVAQREPRRLLELVDLPGLVLAGGIVVGWYGLAYRRAGAEFLTVQLVHENLDRAVGTGSFARQRKTHHLRMLEAFAYSALPWNLALLGAWRARGGWQTRFLHAWWIVILAVFTIAAGKREVYLLPIYPAIALIAADRVGARITRWPLAVAALSLVAVAAATATIGAEKREAARSELRAFVEAVVHAVPATATVAVRGRVSENDRLVLAYRLHRPVPRPGDTATNPDFLVVPASAPDTLVAGCTRVPLPTTGHAALALVACR
jgi:4-amino-4-deoxy-L-arabinose transferase-like glycosyltransferase